MALSPGQKDAVTRLMEEGVLRSADLLGRMSHASWNVVSSSVDEMAVAVLRGRFEREALPHIGVRLRSRSGLPVDFLVVFPPASARAVTDAITLPMGPSADRIPDRVNSVIGEVSNTLTQGVAGTLADRFELSVILSSPEVLEAPKSKLLSWAMEGREDVREALIFSRVDMFSRNLCAECHMVLLLRSDALQGLV